MNDSFLRNSDGHSRRRFLSYASKTLLGVSILPGMIPLNAGAASTTVVTPAPAPAVPGRKPTARNIIYLYMAGGMTHVDTFDPKPEAGEKVAGPVKAISTKADDVQISEYFPMLAKQMDKVAIVRGLSTTQGAHEQGNYFMHSSYTMRGTIQHPGIGAWLLRMEGRTNRTLPGSVCIGGGATGGGAGFMESKFAPLYVGSPTSGVPNSKSNVSSTQFEERLSLANKFDQAFHERYDQKKVRAYSDMYDDAVRLMKSEDLKAFNLMEEDPKVRAEYGENGFGQGCLLARRLVENDVRHVEVTLGGWDTHTNNFQAVERLSATLDKAMGALLQDLERRGMLEETMVVLCTEFGRTPVINENDGRDHYPKAFSALIAGGGIKGGMVHGKTNEMGTEVVEGKIAVPDFNATIAYGLGLPLDQVIYSPSKRPFTVADKGQPILSLFS
ncbi:MAG: DUF1501 domain-containing protein [Verrucomicrobiota bacterium]